MRKFIGIIVFFLLVQICTAATLNVPADYPTIQAGIDIAVDGDTVLVADGVYFGNGNRDLDFNGVNMVVMSVNGPESTIIDCQADTNNPHRAFHFHNNEDTLSVVDGFTIRNGYVIEEEEYSDYGGGILCRNASPKIKNCIFKKNFATRFGGGISLYSSNSVVENCIFKNNSARHGGGFASYNSSNPIIDKCSFVYNTALQQGGGAYSALGTPEYINCTFSNNSAVSYGGGIRVASGSITVDNCIIAYSRDGEGIRGAAQVSCTDIYGNLDGDWAFDIADQYGIDGNISLEPIFCDTLSGDFYLKSISPCQEDSTGCGLMGAMDVGCVGGTIFPVAIDINYGESADFDTVFIETPEFYWSYQDTSATTQQGFELEVGLDPDWSVAELWSTGQVVSSDTMVAYAGIPLVNHGKYYLRVRLTNGINWGEWNESIFYTRLSYIMIVPSDFPTIQAGIDFAWNQDTVLIAPGIYSGEGNREITTAGKSIIVKGIEGANNTIIDCEGFNGFSNIDTREENSTVIEGFTITNGINGIKLDDSWPVLNNLILIDNSQHGISYEPPPEKIDTLLERKTTFINDCNISNNGACGISALSGWPGLITIRNCILDSNQESGVHIISSRFILKNSNLNNNNYGAFYGHGGDGASLIDSCYFNNCDTAILTDPISEVDIRNTKIKNGISGIVGGAYFATDHVENCIFDSLSGVVIYGSIHAKNCEFRNNSGTIATALPGEPYEPTELFFDSCQFFDNFGGLACRVGYIKLSNSVFKHNQGNIAIVGKGGNIHIDKCLFHNDFSTIVNHDSSYINIYNSTFVSNYSNVFENVDTTGIDIFSIYNCIAANNVGIGALSTDPDAKFHIECSDFFNNAGGNFVGIPDQTGLNGNISENPLFCENDTLEYNIALSSPCAPDNNSCGVPMGAGEVVDCQPDFPPVAVISIDRSGSMFYTDPLGKSRLERAKTLAHSEIDKLLAVDDPVYPGVYWVAVQYFNASGIVLLQDYSSDPMVLHNAINAIPGPKHDTPLAAAMCQAHCLVSAEDYPNKYVITFTDGLENESQNFDLCEVCDPCIDLIETGWNFDCDPSIPESCTDWQICLADQFSTTGVNLVHYFGEPINPFDKSKNYEGLEDMHFLKSTAEESQGGFFYHSDQQIDGYIPGDANHDLALNLADAIFILNYVFSGGDAPEPYEAGDLNFDDTVNISDAVRIIQYVFGGETDN